MKLTETEVFSLPEGNSTIWRYMDFTKFVSMLETQKLHFPRADLFEDPYEGMWSSHGVKLLRESPLYRGLTPEPIDALVGMMDSLRQQMYISCWHASEHESAAMWKLYLQGDAGVAIRSDSDTLAIVLGRSPLKVDISLVRYIDYDSEVIPFDNIFFPFVHKRLSFSHEKELRAIIWGHGDTNRPQISDDAAVVAVDVPVDELVKSVHVSPTAPKWFGELVEQVVRRYGLDIRVIRSNLYDRPTW